MCIAISKIYSCGHEVMQSNTKVKQFKFMSNPDIKEIHDGEILKIPLIISLNLALWFVNH